MLLCGFLPDLKKFLIYLSHWAFGWCTTEPCLLCFCFKAYFKEFQRGRKTHRNLPSAGSFPKLPQWLELSQAKTRSQEFHPGIPHELQGPDPLCTLMGVDGDSPILPPFFLGITFSCPMSSVCKPSSLLFVGVEGWESFCFKQVIKSNPCYCKRKAEVAN